MKAAKVKVQKQMYKGEVKANNKAHKLNVKSLKGQLKGNNKQQSLNIKYLKERHKTEVTDLGKELQVSHMSTKSHHHL